MEHLQEYEGLNYVDEDEIVEQLISDWTFFLPSVELTSLVLSQNDKLGSEYFAKEYQAFRTSAARHIDQNILVQRLQKAAGILFHELNTAESPRQSEEEIIATFQAFFSERIFNHLARLSRTPYAKTGTFSIKEELTIELAEKIGLGLYLHEKTLPQLREETEEILLKLAFEFQRWFLDEHQGVFFALWGPMFSVDKKDLREKIQGNSIVLVPDVKETTKFTTADQLSALREERSLA